MFLLTILIVTIIQHIYLYIFYNNTNTIAEKKEIFTYNLYDYNHELTVYKCGNLQSNKILFILSGSYSLSFDTYIQKIVPDLLVIDYIKNNYQIIILEKNIIKSVFLITNGFSYEIFFKNISAFFK